MKRFITPILLLASLNTSAATKVLVAPLSELLTAVSQSAPAQVINENHVVLSARVNGEIEAVLVKVGDEVSAEQLLLKIECRDYELKTAQAESSLSSLKAQARLARQQLSRAERLLQQKNASRELRDQRRAELDSLLAQQKGAEARLQESQIEVDRCSVKAPFAGVVTEKIISPGALASPGTQLIKVLQLGAQEVSARLSAEQVSSIQQGQGLHYIYADDQYPVALRSALPLVEAKSRTQEIRFSFDNEPAMSGSSGRIYWQEAQGRLPVKYVVSRDGKLGVMTLEEDKAVFIHLPEAIEGQAAPAGLLNGRQIIIEGQHAVSDGEVVTVVEQE